MKRHAVWLLIALLAGGCAPATTGRNLQPAAQTNDLAITNLNLGLEYLRRGEHEKALEKLEKARQADPSYPLTYNSLGVLYQRLGDYGKAEQSFKKALQLDASNSPTMNNYGRLLCQRGRADEAQAVFLRAADNPLYETPEIPITNAGICAFNNGRVEDAEKFFRRALELKADVPAALLQMARLSYNQGRFLPARGYLQRYIAVETHTPQSLWLGIQIEQQLGDKDTVSSYALLLRNSFPDSEEARMLRESGMK